MNWETEKRRERTAMSYNKKQKVSVPSERTTHITPHTRHITHHTPHLTPRTAHTAHHTLDAQETRMYAKKEGKKWAG